VAEARRAWTEDNAPRFDPARLVFLDETWAATALARPRGRCPRGERLVCPVPQGRWRTTTFLCALRADGPVAPLVLDGAIDGPTFLAWVERMLAPALRPGDTVVADNLGSHKVAGVREAIEARGASLLYLPPYSPDLNPIELAFSKLKRLLRAAAARTADALWTAIAAALRQFTPAECANYPRHCGYVQSGR
jgi:transposase